MARPWRNWVHGMGNTFGTWLPGDERGWRSWRHRDHCDGDYKNPPPPGAHESRLRRSRTLMKRPPVFLTWEERVVAARAMGERLIDLDVELIDLCVSKVHFHLVARFSPVESSANALALLYEKVGLVAENMLGDGRDPLPRHMIGLAKKHATFTLREAEFIHDGGVWAKKCKVVPIENREHQVRAVRYLREHVDQGAAVLSIIAPEMVARLAT